MFGTTPPLEFPHIRTSGYPWKFQGPQPPMHGQGGKFVGCAEDLRRGVFTNRVYIGAEMYANELSWRTGA